MRWAKSTRCSSTRWLQEQECRRARKPLSGAASGQRTTRQECDQSRLGVEPPLSMPGFSTGDNRGSRTPTVIGGRRSLEEESSEKLKARICHHSLGAQRSVGEMSFTFWPQPTQRGVGAESARSLVHHPRSAGGLCPPDWPGGAPAGAYGADTRRRALRTSYRPE